MKNKQTRPKEKSRLPENVSHKQHLKYEERIGEAFAERWCPHHTCALKAKFTMCALLAEFVNK